MKKSLLCAGVAVGILDGFVYRAYVVTIAAECTDGRPNGASTGVGQTESAPQGWVATATQAVPFKFLATGRSQAVSGLSEATKLHVVVGLYMRDRAGADQLVRAQYHPGHATFHHWLTPSEFTAKFNPSASSSRVGRRLSQARRLYEGHHRAKPFDRERQRLRFESGIGVSHDDPRVRR